MQKERRLDQKLNVPICSVKPARKPSKESAHRTDIVESAAHECNGPVEEEKKAPGTVTTLGSGHMHEHQSGLGRSGKLGSSSKDGGVTEQKHGDGRVDS